MSSPTSSLYPGSDADLSRRLQQTFCSLAQGFLDFRRNGLRPGSQMLEALHLNCVAILLRLYVLCYAEATLLLPATDDTPYGRFYSLQALVAQVRGGEATPDPTQTTLWGRLRRLWQLLAEGRPELGAPRLASWLFLPQVFPFLDQYRLADDVVCRVLEWLPDIYPPVEHPAGRRTWGAREFAAFYGSLLDVQLQYATGPVVVRREAGSLRVLAQEEPAQADAEFEDIAIEAGTVFLISRFADRRPASASDSASVIKRTLEPTLRELGAPFGRQKPPVNPEVVVQRIFSLRIVDPAAHAGQMLLDIADYLAARLARILPAATISEDDWRRQCLTTCLSGLTLEPAALHVAALTVALESDPGLTGEHAPLIRIGNPLLGVRLSELLAAGPGRNRRHRSEVGMEQLAIWDAGATVEFQNWRTDVDDKLPQIRQLADIWVAGRTGLPVSRDAWRGLVNMLLHDGWQLPQLARLQEEAGLLAEREHFFHPELSMWESMPYQPGDPRVLFLGDPLHVERLLEELRGKGVPARVAELQRIVHAGRDSG